MDYLVIETTGVADPNPIVFTFEKDAALSARCFVESVVTVVNAEAMVDDGDESRMVAMPHPCTGEPVFLITDFPHLFARDRV